MGTNDMGTLIIPPSVFRSAPEQTTAPEKPKQRAISNPPDVSSHTRSGVLFGLWAGITAASAWVDIVTALFIGSGNASPTILSDAGDGIRGGGIACAIGGTANCFVSFVKFLTKHAEIQKQIDDNRQGAQDYKKTRKARAELPLTDRHTFSRPPYGTPCDGMANAENMQATEPLLPETHNASANSEDAPVTAAQTENKSNKSPADQLADDNLNAYSKCRDAKVDKKRHIKTAVTICVSFLRDALLSPANTGISIATTAKKVCDSTLGTALQVAAPVAGIASTGLGIATGACQIGQGINDYRNASIAHRIANAICTRIQKCLDPDRLPVLLQLRSAKDKDKSKVDKYTGTLNDLEYEALTEYEHIRDVFGVAFERFNENHQKELEAQETLKWRAKLRIAYGIATTSVATVGLVLTLTGVGAVIGLPTLAAVGAVIGVGWLAYATYGVLKGRKAILAAAKLEQKQREEAGDCFKLPLATLEAKHKGSANPQMTIAMLARHLMGGKAEATATRGKGQIALDTLAENQSLGGELSAKGLQVRRQTASRLLLEAGMKPDEVRGVKMLLATGSEMDRSEALKKIERFILGDAGRVLWKSSPSESVVVESVIVD